MVRTMVGGIGVLDKVVAVLDALEASPRTLAELVDATGVPRATAHRLAVALEDHRLVDRDDEGRFRLGPRLAQLGAAADGGTDALVAAAMPALRRLRDATEESVQLFVARGDVRVCVASLESPHGLRTIVPVGAALPMDKGSAAHALRDELPPRRGWVDSAEERERGVASVSAPVRDRDGRVVAAVSASGPVDRLTRTPGRRHGAAVVAAAVEVERAL